MTYLMFLIAFSDAYLIPAMRKHILVSATQDFDREMQNLSFQEKKTTIGTYAAVLDKAPAVELLTQGGGACAVRKATERSRVLLAILILEDCSMLPFVNR